MTNYTFEQVKGMTVLPEGWGICLECNQYFYAEFIPYQHFHELKELNKS